MNVEFFDRNYVLLSYVEILFIVFFFLSYYTFRIALGVGDLGGVDSYGGFSFFRSLRFMRDLIVN